MSLSTLLLGLAAFARPSIAGYVLEDDYSPANFFSMFSFFTSGDPTHGFVQYQAQDAAQNAGLINTNNNLVYMGVDSTNVAPNGRDSVRITSNKAYNHGLIVLDLAHMPEGCGTWPAFWMVGPDWPNNGEIDIIEGVNAQNTNSMTLHTAPGCTIGSGSMTGSVVTPNCDVNAAGQPANAGCSISNGNTQSYGSGFNSAGGGVYATEWTSAAINVWYFARNAIPGDISSGNPDPSGWGTPAATFQGSGCNIDSSIKNQQIVFDTTFCGDWAGAVWGSGSCASQAGTCNDFVQNNPAAFVNAYWSINSLRVYQDETGTSQQKNAGPSGVAASLPVPVSTLAPIPDAASTSTSTSSSIQEIKTPVVVSSVAPTTTETPHPLTALSWPVPSADANPDSSNNNNNNLAQDPSPTPSPSPSPSILAPPPPPPPAPAPSAPTWMNGQPLQSDFFGSGSSGIPAKRRLAESQSHRRHARHLQAHKRLHGDKFGAGR